MRILHVGLSSSRGGIEGFAESYANALKDSGVTFDFADIYGCGINVNTAESRIYTLPSFKRHPIKCERALTELMKDARYDAVHIHISSEANALAVRAARAAGIRPVLHLHFSSSNGLIRKIAHIFTRRVFRTADAIRIAPTRDAGRWFFGNTPFSVFPNAICTEKFRFDGEARERVRGALGIGDDCFALGFIGRLEKVKNPLFAIKVLRTLKDGYSDLKIRLIVIGRGRLEKSMRSYAKRLGVSDTLTFIGHTNEVSDYISALDALIMPSKSEAMSLAALEAQTSGLPVLFSDRIPSENKLIDGSVMLPLCSPERFAETIYRLSSSDTESRAAVCDTLVGTAYDVRHSGKSLRAVYESLSHGGA